MGGVGSTRWEGHRRALTVEDCIRLRVGDLGALMRAGRGAVGHTTWTLTRTIYLRTERLRYEAFLTIEETPDGERLLDLTYGRLTLAPNGRVVAGEDDPTYTGPIRLAHTEPPVGCTERDWFVCPSCTERRRLLYLPTEQWPDVWMCRECHELTYRSRQRHDKFVDPYLRMNPLRRACAVDLLADPYDKVRVLEAAQRAPWHSWEFYDRRRERQAITGSVPIPPSLEAAITGRHRGRDRDPTTHLFGKSSRTRTRV